MHLLKIGYEEDWLVGMEMVLELLSHIVMWILV